jgi:SAM-dependent methyltransferase
MLRSDSADGLAHYFRTGQQAVTLIEKSLALSGARLESIRSCLVLPSGYGRVIRHLVHRLDPQHITASDIDRQAMRFCAHEFAVKTHPSALNPANLSLPSSYDLIFVGSLLTHLPPSDCFDLLAVLARTLVPGGHLVFTTQGESCIEHLHWYGPEFAPLSNTFADQLRATGQAYAPYRNRTTYGITIFARPHLEASIAHRFCQKLRFLGFEPRAWDAHQDLWTFQALT